jgi:hypothetical protein
MSAISSDNSVSERILGWEQRIQANSTPTSSEVLGQNRNNPFMQAKSLERRLMDRYNHSKQTEASISVPQEFYIYHDGFSYGGVTCWTIVKDKSIGYGFLQDDDLAVLRPGQIVAVMQDDIPDDIDDLIQYHWNSDRYHVYENYDALVADLRTIQPDNPISTTFIDADGKENNTVNTYTFEHIMELHLAGSNGILS